MEFTFSTFPTKDRKECSETLFSVIIVVAKILELHKIIDTYASRL